MQNDPQVDEKTKRPDPQWPAGGEVAVREPLSPMARFRAKRLRGVIIRRTLFLGAIIAYFGFRVASPARIECAAVSAERVDCIAAKRWAGLVPVEAWRFEDVRRVRSSGQHRSWFALRPEENYFYFDAGQPLRANRRLEWLDAQKRADLARVTKDLNVWLSRENKSEPFVKTMAMDFMNGCLAVLAFTMLIAFIERAIKRSEARQPYHEVVSDPL